MLRLLGKVWPVGGPLLVSSQRGKGPFGVGGNGVTTTRSSPVNPVPACRGISENLPAFAVDQWRKGLAVALGFAMAKS